LTISLSPILPLVPPASSRLFSNAAPGFSPADANSPASSRKGGAEKEAGRLFDETRRDTHFALCSDGSAGDVGPFCSIPSRIRDAAKTAFDHRGGSQSPWRKANFAAHFPVLWCRFLEETGANNQPELYRIKPLFLKPILGLCAQLSPFFCCYYGRLPGLARRLQLALQNFADFPAFRTPKFQSSHGRFCCHAERSEASYPWGFFAELPSAGISAFSFLSLYFPYFPLTSFA
jgi:hypothetical protein